MTLLQKGNFTSRVEDEVKWFRFRHNSFQGFPVRFLISGIMLPNFIPPLQTVRAVFPHTAFR